MELTIDLPDSVFQQLRATAKKTEQPLGELVRQSITGNLPPSVESVPSEMQSELLRMQSLNLERLSRIAREQIPQDQQTRHTELLSKNQDGTLTTTEQAELNDLVRLVDQLMLKKAHACAILRWRGKPVGNLENLPKPEESLSSALSMPVLEAEDMGLFERSHIRPVTSLISLRR